MAEEPDGRAPGLLDNVQLLGVALISGASLMLELVLTRLFSVTLFYHFAFLVVSLALFGIGVAGVVVYLRQRAYNLSNLARALALNSIGFGLTAVLALGVVLTKQVPPGVGLDALLDLALLYLVAALPFFFSGMCLSLAITLCKQDVSRVYFYDLTGASVGCLLTIPALNLLGGPTAMLTSGAIGATASVVFLVRKKPWWPVALGMAVLFWGLVALDAGIDLFRVPSVKAINEEKVVFSRWNSFSRVTVSETAEDFMWMNIDSDAATRIFSASAWQNDRRANFRFSETRLASLVYSVGEGGHALIIGPGGGADVLAALSRGVDRVSGVELNGIIARDVMQEQFAEYSGYLYLRPDVEIFTAEGRSFIRRSDERYDYIQATLVDTWAATSAGAFTLSENTLYTVEAFCDFIDHLQDDGVLSMTRWLRRPPREFVRLISLAIEALRERGLEEYRRHFFVAADSRMASFLLKRTPFEDEELEVLRQTCHRDGLRILYDPLLSPGKGGLIGRLIQAPDPGVVWEEHPLDISPPTDDRPFFFYTGKPSDFLKNLFSAGQEKNDAGVSLLASLLIIVAVAVVLFFLIPLFAFRRSDPLGSFRMKSLGLFYFCAIGVGFIGLEISWMQHFVLFLGHPIYALGVVLFVLLLGTGAGSYLTGGIEPHRALSRLWPSVGALAALVVLYGVALGPLFRALIGLVLPLRILLAGILLFLPGLIMGRMMPLGIKTLTDRAPGIVPWAWGINGAASVFGSVLAIILAMNVGYSVTQIISVSVYVLGTVALWLACRGESRKKVAEQGSG